MFESELLAWLSYNLIRFGPGVLFFACLLEGAIFAGLIVPVGALIAFSAMLSSRAVFEPSEVIAAALLGALTGDQIGFIVGRWFVSAARPPRGEVARIWSATMKRTDSLIRTRGAIGISLARAIPFVRTMMPWFAGRSGIRWPRFFIFDLIGVLLWGTVYIGGGFLAGEGWRQIAGRYGEAVGAIAAAILVIALLLLTRRLVPRVLARARNRPSHEMD